MQAECVLLQNIINVAQERVNHFGKKLLKECKFAEGCACQLARDMLYGDQISSLSGYYAHGHVRNGWYRHCEKTWRVQFPCQLCAQEGETRLFGLALRRVTQPYNKKMSANGISTLISLLYYRFPVYCFALSSDSIASSMLPEALARFPYASSIANPRSDT